MKTRMINLLLPVLLILSFTIHTIHAQNNTTDTALVNYHIEENDTIVASTYHSLGIQYYNQSNFDSALFYLNKALQINKEILGEKHIRVGDNYNCIGNLYRKKIEYDLALEYLIKSLQIRTELLGEKHGDVAKSYYDIGIVYNRKFEFDLALEYYFKSLQIQKELPGEKHVNVAATYNTIGYVYFDNNKLGLALKYYFKSLQINTELFGEHSSPVATNYNNIGAAYLCKSLIINREIYGENSFFEPYSDTAGIDYPGKKEYDSALLFHNKALKIRKGLFGEKHTSVAQSYSNIGTVYLQYNEYDLILQYFHKAISASIKDFNDTINIYAVPVINNYLNWEWLLQALYVKAGIFANIYDKFQACPKQQDLEAALHHYHACDTLITKVRREMTSKSDKLRLSEIANVIYKPALEVCYKLAKYSEDHQKKQCLYEQAFYFSEEIKSLILLESITTAEAQKFAGIADTLLAIEHKRSTEIALYNQILAEEPDSSKEMLVRDKLFMVNRCYDSLLAIFEINYPKYYQLKYDQKPPTVPEIQVQLDSKTAILSYFVKYNSIVIFTLTNSKLDITITPIKTNFDTIIQNFHYYGLSYNTNPVRFAKLYKQTANDLYQQLIPKNIDTNINNLIIIPDAELGLIPFETLLTEKPVGQDWKGLPYLIRKYNISYAYSANLFYKTFKRKPDHENEFPPINDWLALAPVFDDEYTAGTTLKTRSMIETLYTSVNDTMSTRSLLVKGMFVRELPGTETEVKRIFNEFEKKNLKATLKTHLQANEAFVKSGELKNYKYLHFATHGFVNTTKPELSGIFLAQDTLSAEDGILYTGEMYNLELNSELLVLSACETGLGKISKGEGIMGFSRALLYAGAKNMMVSLWKVTDVSTTELMINFYRNMLEDYQQSNISGYLRQAKLKMISEGTYAHPYYWSPFILIGK
ncbi:MAG: CHAT domain-containing protein [Bacteroidales bacterium]|nr:CHAT domain-containing protein [Bacteroidales bacterium]